MSEATLEDKDAEAGNKERVDGRQENLKFKDEIGTDCILYNVQCVTYYVT